MNKLPTYDDLFMARVETDLAMIGQSIETSWYGQKIRNTKEPYDRPDNAMGAAYAMFKFLVSVGVGSGREHEWWQFLVESLKECIEQADEKLYTP